jgi:hypothetical protein
MKKYKIVRKRVRNTVFDVTIDKKGNGNPDDFTTWTFSISDLEEDKWKRKIEKSFKKIKALEEQKNQDAIKQKIQELNALKEIEVDDTPEE